MQVGKDKPLASAERVKDKLCEMTGLVQLKLARREVKHTAPVEPMGKTAVATMSHFEPGKLLSTAEPSHVGTLEKTICIELPKPEHPKLKQYKTQLQQVVESTNPTREEEADFNCGLQAELEKQQQQKAESAGSPESSEVPNSILPLIARIVQGR